MVWETSPKKRNVNNEVKFLVDANQDVSCGDVLVGSFNYEQMSNYVLTDITNIKQSNIKGKDYITAVSTWSNKMPLLRNYNLFTNSTFNKLYNL